MRPILLGVVAIALTGVAAAGEDKVPKPTDEEIKKLLVGTWASDETEGEIRLKGTTTFNKDGTGTAAGTAENGRERVTIALSTTWAVKDGKIVCTITKSNIPDVVKVGHTSSDEILSVTATEFQFKSENGQVRVQKRVKGERQER